MLDSLARSGTTLLSALLRSQKNTIAFCPGFNEPLCCENIGEWPHGFCKREFVENPKFDFKKFQEESISHIKDFAQYYGIEASDWEKLILDSDSAQEIRSKIENKFSECKFICYRWNQCLWYFYEWVSRGEDFLWLTMIRNPLDRACSSWKKHRWSIKQSLENTMHFAHKVEQISNHKNFHLIYYEDLVSNPEKILKEIYSFFGQNIQYVNLSNIKGSNGEDFIPQSSDLKNVYQKKDGYLTEGDAFSGLYNSKINRYKDEEYIDEITYQAFKRFLSEFSVYKRYFKD